MKNTFFRDLMGIGSSKILIIVFSLTTSIIIARTLGPEKNGIIATLLVYPSLFMTIGSLGIRQSTAFYLGKGIFTENQVKTAITQIWIFSSLTSVFICFILMHYLSKTGDNLFLVVLALVPIPFSLFNTFNSGIFLGKNEINMFNKINWIPPLIIFLLTSLFVLGFSLGIEGYMYAMIGGALFVFSLLLFKNKFIQSFSLKVEWLVIQKMVKLGLIYAFALLIINLNYQIDVILLDFLSTPFETGIYSKGAGIIQYLWQIPMLLSTLIFARSTISKNEMAFSIKVAQLLRISLILIVLGSLMLFILSDYIIIGLFGNKFTGSVNVLNILLPGVVLLTFFKVMNMDLAGKGKPWISLKAMVPSLIVNIGLNYLLIPTYGADGAAFASTVSYSFAALLFLHFYSKETSIPIKQILYYHKSDFAPIVQIIRKLKT